ncbi:MULTISPECIES: TetR/AcrR family transcriptional regulator [unclassified Streptococcus]|uniref:TetR/AcrR family transcriptional regulator n=1 Tax=unclassified Streptococcus TaxID=2608887 RepID=UPI00359E5E67
MTKTLDYLHRSNQENHQLTKEAIETALLLLLEQKSLKKIAITELVERAGVARNSFYRNYSSKENVLRVMLKERFAQLASTNVAKFQENRQAGLLGLFQFIAADFRFYQLLLAEGLRELEAYRYQPIAFEEPDQQTYYRNRFVAAGITRVICDWLGEKNPQSPEDMAEQLNRLFE